MSAISFFIYLAQVSLYAAIMWGIYCAVWRGKPLLRGSRVYLLASLVLPVLLPLIRLPVAENSRIVAYQITLPEVVVGSAADLANQGESVWAMAGLWVYAVVAVALLLLYVRSYILLFRKLSQGRLERYGDYSIVTGAGIGPGTIGRRIFFPADEINASILQHEQGHIRAGHRFDGALMQVLHVLLWASPAHWLIRRELKLVHEYEADRMAISSASDIEQYGRLMLSQSLGVHSASIAHSFFHHPLKLRIKMLQNAQGPNRRRRIYVIAGMLIILFSGAVVLAQTKKAKNKKPIPQQRRIVSMNDTVTLQDPVTGEQKMVVSTKTDTVEFVSVDAEAYKQSKLSGSQRNKDWADVSATLPDGRVVYKFVERMPEFNGKLADWLSSHITYPEPARKAGWQGRSVVQFVVNEDGHVSDAKLVRGSGFPLLDNEAMRVVAAMPHWIPGTQAGQPVPVYFTLPVTFKLDK